MVDALQTQSNLLETWMTNWKVYGKSLQLVAREPEPS